MGFDVQLTETPRGWELTDADDMLQAAKELCDDAVFGKRFHGSISFWWVNGTLTWSLDVHDDEQPKRPATGALGDWMLLAGGVLRKLTPEEFTAIAQPAEGGS